MIIVKLLPKNKSDQRNEHRFYNEGQNGRINLREIPRRNNKMTKSQSDVFKRLYEIGKQIKEAKE